MLESADSESPNPEEALDTSQIAAEGGSECLSLVDV